MGFFRSHDTVVLRNPRTTEMSFDLERASFKNLEDATFLLFTSGQYYSRPANLVEDCPCPGPFGELAL
jgi:hypothetical protein